MDTHHHPNSPLPNYPLKTNPMNTQNLKDTGNKLIDSFAKGFVIFVLALTVYAVGAQATTTKQPLAPQAQRSYDASRMAFCEAEKTLAQSKLKDYTEGNLKLSPDQVKDLAEKNDNPCSGF